MEKRHIGIAAGLIKRAGHVDEGLPSLVSHVTFGSFTLEPRDGNKEPVYWFDEATGMSLNAVELKNQGIEDFLWNDLPMLEHLPRAGCEVRISLAPLKSGDLAEMIRVLFRYQLTNPVVSEIEVNAACPNHKDESGRLHDVLAHDPNALNELMSEAMEYRGPKAIKIAPDMSHASLVACVELALKYGFGTIVNGNTLLSDAQGHLSVPKGGMAGTPLLERAVAQTKKLRGIVDSMTTGHGPSITVIGCGGVMSARDAKKHLNAGAHFVQTATYFSQFGTRGIRDMAVELA